ncbi:hypothetical protein FRX31_033340 [Thalictrum thalictroides]|uniref:Uncharacterized protein n=1 Tax=Thalictrum thalictroides TaxID=46969 RepID=A0A7J6UXZ5_THATH|nr:hypothetical protein FRX31_033340 [Thalictrum thalictroides]
MESRHHHRSYSQSWEEDQEIIKYTTGITSIRKCNNNTDLTEAINSVFPSLLGLKKQFPYEVQKGRIWWDWVVSEITEADYFKYFRVCLVENEAILMEDWKIIDLCLFLSNVPISIFILISLLALSSIYTKSNYARPYKEMEILYMMIFRSRQLSQKCGLSTRI